MRKYTIDDVLHPERYHLVKPEELDKMEKEYAAMKEELMIQGYIAVGDDDELYWVGSRDRVSGERGEP